MDAKALAKSKRAHSLHHSKKSHPNPRPKPAGAGAGGSKASSEKPIQPRQPRPAPDLPSNWSRYEEEHDSDAEAPSGEVPSQSPEVPPPKSKGADYKHLIAEAKSQPQSYFDPHLDNFPSMDDVLHDFVGRGAGPLLSSARGEAILSMVKDDSFVVEDKATGGHEAPFLSLNLNVLAERLEQVGLARRLFIESDLLPLELLTEASSSGIDKEPVLIKAGKNGSAVELLGGPNQDHFTVDKIKDNKDEITIGCKAQELASASGVSRVAVGTSRPHLHNQTIASESTKQSSTDQVAELKSKPSTFKATAAEAELDALLDSLSDTRLTDTFDFGTSRWPINPEGKDPRKGQEPSKAMPTPSSTNMDVLLDDLLEETSKLSTQNGSVAPASSSASKDSARSKVLDDFDSWLDTI
ncbi:hypothetical protein SAY87_008139 [Trapa incisa]|uniref:Uncharacterized protein n=1 Tax=Trapa incisa TaxID=236973 RepID=A0AAN7KHP1_9MYRT|nr:hypothetical protein SAY87_008139 [Trapa incisa]